MEWMRAIQIDIGIINGFMLIIWCSLLSKRLHATCWYSWWRYPSHYQNIFMLLVDTFDEEILNVIKTARSWMWSKRLWCHLLIILRKRSVSLSKQLHTTCWYSWWRDLECYQNGEILNVIKTTSCYLLILLMKIHANCWHIWWRDPYCF